MRILGRTVEFATEGVSYDRKRGDELVTWGCCKCGGETNFNEYYITFYRLLIRVSVSREPEPAFA